METLDSIPPITEDDIVQFLVNTPSFFERHAELLGSVQLTSPHGQRAVSLQERQVELLREKLRHLEQKYTDMIRHGQENVAIADKLHRWTCQVLQARDPSAVPATLEAELSQCFQVPQVALRLWGVDEAYVGLPQAQPVSADAKAFASSLTSPYCGANKALEAVAWLPQPHAVASMALVPLRQASAAPAVGLLVLASDDAHRFHAAMGTEFLERIGELAAAALARLY